MNSEAHTGNEHVNTEEPRYEAIERNNQASFVLNEPSLQVIHSLHSVGNTRDTYEKTAALAARTILAGNMSPLNNYGPSELTPEERIGDAKQNMAKFLNQNSLNPNEVRLLAPERDYSTPLTIINLDQTDFEHDDADLLRPTTKGDFMYTYNSDLALAARPADCPVAFVSASTPNGELTALVHFAWLGVAHGYIDQAHLALDNLGVDWESIRIKLSAGAHAKSYKYTNYDSDPRQKFPVSDGLFTDIKKNDTNQTYDFAIDVAAATYEQILKNWEITPYQIFMDTTDTAAPEVGYSSHSRTHKNYPVDGQNTRDIVIGRRP